MTAPNGSTFDGNPNASPATTVGYRPGQGDFNGAALTDDPSFPPDPATMPTAELFNTYAYLLISICKAIGVAGAAITAGVSPVVSSFWTAALLIASNPFTVTRNGVGDYSITWAANLFPIAGQPRARINALIGATNASIGAVNITNGVRIQTTQGGALTDLNFSFEVF
jgi:hypothetical protein